MSSPKLDLTRVLFRDTEQTNPYGRTTKASFSLKILTITIGKFDTPELYRPLGTGPFKTLAPGALLRVLDFSSPEFFLTRFDFSPSPLTAPGSLRRIWEQ